MKIQKNVLLKNYTTFRIGGKAKYFFEAETKEDLIGAIKLAKKMKLPFFVLGGGSNILVADRGYKGLVIKMQNAKIKMQKENSKCKIFCGAGTPLSLIISETIKNNLTGFEWASGIPGTVGGAIYGNAGAFGKSMKDVVKTVTVLENGKIKLFQNKNCKFGYRDSIFKTKKNCIIISAELQLKKGNKKNIKNKTDEYLKYRKERQPLNFPSAGSVFENPVGFSAGELIDKCGLKGKKIGNVRISEKHANFIVNLGGGEAKDVIKLIKLIKKEVKKKFGIVLKEEIQFLSY